MDVATALYLLINRVDKKGEVTYDKITRKINLNWDESNTIKMRENAKYFIRKMNNANGEPEATSCSITVLEQIFVIIHSADVYWEKPPMNLES